MDSPAKQHSAHYSTDSASSGTLLPYGATIVFLFHRRIACRHPRNRRTLKYLSSCLREESGKGRADLSAEGRKILIAEAIINRALVKCPRGKSRSLEGYSGVERLLTARLKSLRKKSKGSFLATESARDTLNRVGGRPKVDSAGKPAFQGVETVLRQGLFMKELLERKQS